MKLRLVLVTLFASVALSGCVQTAEFGGSGGSFGGSGGSSQAGERLARQVCEQAIRDQGQQVVKLYRSSAVDYPYRGAGRDLYFTVRRDSMTVSTSRVWCRFMYDTGRARLTSA